MRILFATGNEHKVHEIKKILNDPSFEVLSMKEVGITSEPEEDGSTFEENALIKAKALSIMLPGFYGPVACGSGNECPAGMPAVDTQTKDMTNPSGVPMPKKKYDMHFDVVLSDDSGLEIDALDKAPGIESARFMGHETDYLTKCNAILDMLKETEEKDRTARFVCACAAAFPDGSVHVTRATMEGRIGYEYVGENGFGYDPIFFLPEYGKTSAEISEDEKNAISHRGQALRQMAEYLREKAGKADPA